MHVCERWKRNYFNLHNVIAVDMLSCLRINTLIALLWLHFIVIYIFHLLKCYDNVNDASFEEIAFRFPSSVTLCYKYLETLAHLLTHYIVASVVSYYDNLS